jgi:hypothetical protein
VHANLTSTYIRFNTDLGASVIGPASRRSPCRGTTTTHANRTSRSPLGSIHRNTASPPLKTVETKKPAQSSPDDANNIVSESGSQDEDFHETRTHSSDDLLGFNLN